jgi:hypothetical protein
MATDVCDMKKSISTLLLLFSSTILLAQNNSVRLELKPTASKHLGTAGTCLLFSAVGVMGGMITMTAGPHQVDTVRYFTGTTAATFTEHHLPVRGALKREYKYIGYGLMGGGLVCFVVGCMQLIAAGDALNNKVVVVPHSNSVGLALRF